MRGVSVSIERIELPVGRDRGCRVFRVARPRVNVSHRRMRYEFLRESQVSGVALGVQSGDVLEADGFAAPAGVGDVGIVEFESRFQQ